MKRWVVVVVLLATFVTAAVLVVLVVRFLGTNRVTFTATGTIAPPTVATPPSPVKLDSDPASFTLKQRSWIQLPGGFETPTVTLGDITRGEVLVSVVSSGPTLFSRSMKEGDSGSFVHAGQTVHLKLTKLENRLTGDDFATIELSANQPISEAARIDALIAHLEALDGATFIRNGSPHTAKEAAAHLKRKRDYVGDKITTAEQFIDELASKSSQSDQPYTIKLKDGNEIPAGEYLKTKLPEIDAALRGAK
jgi:hypothetical protein